MDFADLFAKGQEALALLDNAKAAVAAFKGGYEGIKAAVSETDLAKLEAQLSEIHAKNLALSTELDDTMSQLQARG
ncbi:MAG TPA: hypothetical protein VFJ46_17790 [Xanthobacteraceae bacterium]|nr:hypothetical protein [Xanthobacteraceae bacterium]